MTGIKLFIMVIPTLPILWLAQLQSPAMNCWSGMNASQSIQRIAACHTGFIKKNQGNPTLKKFTKHGHHTCNGF